MPSPVDCDFPQTKIIENYDTLYSHAGTWRQNTEKNIFNVTNKFWVPNLHFLRA